MRRKTIYFTMLCLIVAVRSGLAQEGRDDRGNRGDRGSRGGFSFRGGDRGGDRRGEDGAPPDGDAAGKPEEKKRVARYGSARTANKKTAASLTLPSQYATKDTNRDGQIGMYEWSLTDLSSFKKLDLNGDGFLVPSEFANPGTRTTSTTTIVATTGGVTTPTGSFGSGTPDSAPTTPMGSGNNSSSPTTLAGTKPIGATTPQLSADPLIAEGESAFALRDINKDGQLDQEEFDGSVRIKRVFEKAKMTFTGPQPREKFLEIYRQALIAKDAKPM
jgi:hypothetical protein